MLTPFANAVLLSNPTISWTLKYNMLLPKVHSKSIWHVNVEILCYEFENLVICIQKSCVLHWKTCELYFKILWFEFKILRCVFEILWFVLEILFCIIFWLFSHTPTVDHTMQTLDPSLLKWHRFRSGSMIHVKKMFKWNFDR